MSSKNYNDSTLILSKGLNRRFWAIAIFGISELIGPLHVGKLNYISTACCIACLTITCISMNLRIKTLLQAMIIVHEVPHQCYIVTHVQIVPHVNCFVTLLV